MANRPKQVPPVSVLVTLAARNFSADETQPHLYSGMNYMAGVILVRFCCTAYVKAKILEAKYR